MAYQQSALSQAQHVLAYPDQYACQIVQAATFFLIDPSPEMENLFMESYQQFSTVKNILVGPDLPMPPEEASYYDPHELHQPGVLIGTEPVYGWTLKLFPEQLRRHMLIVGMTGSGKSNLLKIIAVNLAKIDK